MKKWTLTILGLIMSIHYTMSDDQTSILLAFICLVGSMIIESIEKEGRQDA